VENSKILARSDAATDVERVVALPPSSAAPVQARRAVAGFPGIGGELGYRVLLLTSEAVTAAVLAASADPCDRIDLRATISRDRVHIEVDPIGASANGPPVRLSSHAKRIFERTAARWGAGDAHPAIWFDLESRPRQQPAPPAPTGTAGTRQTLLAVTE
jgi:hypothetical protein